MPVVVEIAVTALALRGRHDHASRANHAVADTVAGFHHGVDGFLLGLRIRLVQDRVMLGRVEILAFFAELLDAELFERLVDFGGNGFEGFVHFAVFANAIDVIKCRQQCGQHVDDAVLTEAFLLLLANDCGS